MENRTRSKGLLGIGFSMLFILLGIYLITREPQISEIDPALVQGIGIACIVFFGAVIIVKIRRSLK